MAKISQLPRLFPKWYLRSKAAALSLFLVAFALITSPQCVLSEAAAPSEMGSQIIGAISDALKKSREEIGKKLSDLGFGQQVDEILRLDDHPIQSFSPQTMVETLYRRAEAGRQGDGDRFLAVLWNDARKSSAAIDKDPDFEPFRKYKTEQLKEAFIFAPLAAGDLTPLKPVVEKAIGVLSEHYSGGHLARVNGLFLRFLEKPGFNQSRFESALAQSKSTREAIARLLEVGTPPPAKEAALLKIMADTHASSASFAIDPQVLAVMEELSQELPSEIEGYRQAEDKIPSWVLQAEEAASISERGKATKKDEPIIAMWRNRPDFARPDHHSLPTKS